MLHTKTEYRIQYGKLNQELRRKIWQDNITVRKSRLLSNQATHHWEYQSRDEVCDCDNGEEDEGPLPPHRQKHKKLLEQYNQTVGKPQILPLSSVQTGARDKAVQTPEWEGDELFNRLDDTSKEELKRHMSSLTIPEARDSHRRPPSPTHSKSHPPTSSRPRTAMSLTRPSRTSRKLHTETKQTHFVPFGWNEKQTDVGHKQTYNVRAPLEEVHDSAVHASLRKKAEMEMFLAQEKQVKHHTRSRERTTSNSSSLWMSEYQEQFSVKGFKSLSRNCRPLSAPPAPRQPVSWRHS